MDGHEVVLPFGIGGERYCGKSARRSTGLVGTRVRLLLMGATLFVAQQTRAQVQIPVRQLTAPSAISVERLGRVGGLKQLRDGRVLVSDPVRQRLVVLTQTLTSYTTSAGVSGNGSATYPHTPDGALYDYLGDSAVMIDLDSRTFVLVNPDGTLGRAMAAPRPSDLATLIAKYSGRPGFDDRGRFIYRNLGQDGVRTSPAIGTVLKLPSTRDTVSIVRADFDSRTVDRIATATIPRDPEPTLTVGPDHKERASIQVNPVLGAVDEWAVLSDGSVAIVRAQDYHIDWLYADGTRASTPKMPFDWRRLTDQEKAAKLDSARRIIDSVNASGRPYGLMVHLTRDNPRPDTIIATVAFPSISEIPDYAPPFRSGSVRPDRDGNLWILPATSSHAADGLVYDVVNKEGLVFQRVQIPKGRDIAGFGRGGVVYLIVGDRTSGYLLERTRVVGAR